MSTWPEPKSPFTPAELARLRSIEGAKRSGTKRAESQDKKSATYMKPPRKEKP